MHHMSQRYFRRWVALPRAASENAVSPQAERQPWQTTATVSHRMARSRCFFDSSKIGLLKARMSPIEACESLRFVFGALSTKPKVPPVGGRLVQSFVRYVAMTTPELGAGLLRARPQEGRRATGSRPPRSGEPPRAADEGFRGRCTAPLVPDRLHTARSIDAPRRRDPRHQRLPGEVRG
jgi:hypothetical protein